MDDGYWVTFVNPWPEMWGNTWYDTDYVVDGYCVYDRMHSGIGIAITITFKNEQVEPA